MLSFATPLGTHDHRTIVSVILSSGPQWGRVRFDQNAGASRRHRIRLAFRSVQHWCALQTGYALNHVSVKGDSGARVQRGDGVR